MPEVVGGIWITKNEITRSFGIEPGTAVGEGVLPAGESDSGLTIGSYVVYSFEGIAFYGLISSVVVSNDRESGKIYRFSILDNRIRLRWMLVFGVWNSSEDRRTIHARIIPRPPSGEFSSGGLVGDDNADFGSGVSLAGFPPVGLVSEGAIDRSRVYSHICSSQWSSQIKTYTDDPVTASDIIRSAAKYALGGFGFAFNFHSGQDLPVYDIDANNGMSMAGFLETITSAQGLQMTIDGARTLRWVRRGEGVLVIPPPPVHLQDDGLEMSSEATKVRVIGDRNLVQINNISLEPDWAVGWEQFISEPAWLAEVKSVFDLNSATSADRAEIAAMSREVTLAGYIKKKSVSADEFADHGTWDNVSRMNMPVWKYLSDIVYRSYRIPADYEVFGFPLRSLEIHDSLLCAVTIGGSSSDRMVYRQEQVEYYPQANAYVIAKGQPLDLLNFVDRAEAVKLRSKNLRNSWIEMPDFTLDAASHSIRFSTPVFIDGSPGGSSPTSILLFPNKGQGGYADASEGLSEGSDWLNVVVPNPGYEIEPAEVKVSLVFKLGKFFKDFGIGQRWKPESVPNISHHLLMMGSGDSFSHGRVEVFSGELGMPEPSPFALKEILYMNGKNAIDLATEQSEGLIGQSGIERSGKYTRHGFAGVALSGVINRVTDRYDHKAGLVEEVEFSKPRPSSGFVSSKDFARRITSDELFGGQKELQREVRQLRGIAKLEMAASRNEIKRTSNQVITDIFRRSPGTENVTVKTLSDKNSQYPEDRGGEKWRAGDLVWLDDEGLPSREGITFGGIVVSSSALENVVVATSGIVPCAVFPGTDPEISLTAQPGDWFASNTGTYPIGLLSHGSVAPGSDEPVIGLVKIGHGGAVPIASGPFCKLLRDMEAEPPEWKLLGGVVSGGSGVITVPDISLAPIGEEPEDGTHNWLQVSFTALVEDEVLLPGGEVAAVEAGQGTTIPDYVIPTSGEPSGVICVSLGSWSQGKFYQAGCGNMQIFHCPGSLTYARE